MAGGTGGSSSKEPMSQLPEAIVLPTIVAVQHTGSGPEEVQEGP